MATFKTVVRRLRADGLYPVYLRVTHRRQIGYINTNKVVGPNQVASNGDLKDPVVNEYCARTILQYTDKLNRKDVSDFSVAELIEYLKSKRLYVNEAITESEEM